MATTTATAALSMKLLIDRKAQRVLFAEASKEVVDFLFSLLAMPIATAVKLVGKEAMVGCIGNLYASVDKLDSTTNVLTSAAKDTLLCPTAATTTNSSLLRLSPAPPFVQGTVTVTVYTVTDDLTIAPAIPMSAISSISLLNSFAVRDIGDLQEKTVQLGYNEGLAILKASLSLQSKSVLTHVFLHGNGNGNSNKKPGSSSTRTTPIVGTSSRMRGRGRAGAQIQEAQLACLRPRMEQQMLKLVSRAHGCLPPRQGKAASALRVVVRLVRVLEPSRALLWSKCELNG